MWEAEHQWVFSLVPQAYLTWSDYKLGISDEVRHFVARKPVPKKKNVFKETKTGHFKYVFYRGHPQLQVASSDDNVTAIGSVFVLGIS